MVSQKWDYNLEYNNNNAASNDPMMETNMNNLISALLNSPTQKIQRFGESYPEQVNTLRDIETREVFSTKLDNLLQQVKQILRKNYQALQTLKQIFRIIFKYFFYIGDILRRQLNNWVRAT